MGTCLGTWCSELFYFTWFFNYEVNFFKFKLFEMVNLILQETNRINYSYTTFQDTCPRNHCTKRQGQKVDGLLYKGPQLRRGGGGSP